MAWTNDQQRAIDARNKNLLVAAAAGSGKTAVLVERVIKRVLSGDVDIDKILIVTFTNAAAEEMRLRIGKSLSEAAEKNPGDEGIKRQQILLSNASISTIHAFCQNIIRQNFALIDLDPKFRIGDEKEIEILKRDALEAVFEENYFAGKNDFLRFVDDYADEHGDTELHKIITSIYDCAQSRPFPDAWLKEAAERFDGLDEEKLEKSEWVSEARREIIDKLNAAKDITDYIIEIAPELGGEECMPIYEEDARIIDRLISFAGKEWSELSEAVLSVAFSRMKGKWQEGLEENKKYINDKLRKEMKDLIAGLNKKYFSRTLREMLGDLNDVKPVMEAICRLTGEFAAAYTSAKRERGILDFNDLEQLAFQILRAENSTGETLAPSNAALALREKYVEVMVDEYQDTNPLQNAILSLVMREDNPSSFVVGDVKQSIYGFRMADAEIFQRKYTEYPTLGESFERVLLKQNFRSREGVLAVINFIFGKIMSKDAAELEYDEEAALYPGAVFAESDSNTLSGDLELDIIDMKSKASDYEIDGDESEDRAESAKGFELEAAHIAERIKELVVGKDGNPSDVLVYDESAEGKYRPVRWRDIVVLLRGAKGKAGILLQKFGDNDIPAYVSDDTGYFEAIEIKVMLALLQIIDNARQDIPLAAVLHSPIGDFSASEIAEIRTLSDSGDLHDALLAVNLPESKAAKRLKAKTSSFLTRLSSWRDSAKMVSVPELIWQLYEETGYYEYVGSLPGGAQRQANLRMLIDRAADYEKTDFRGLFRFLRFIDKMHEQNSDLAIAASIGESEDVVRVMTIHKSKGLEFPVVILADIGAKFKSETDRLIINRSMGLGPYVYPRPGYRYPSIARYAVAAHAEKKTLAEEMRLLYVALTRAKEKLILVGKARDLSANVNKWCRYLASEGKKLPPQAVRSANSYLDWIIMATVAHEDGEELRSLSLNTAFSAQGTGDTSRFKISILSPREIGNRKAEKKEDDGVLALVKAGKPLPPTKDAERVKEILGWQYDSRGVGDIPAKLTVTEMKRRFGERDEDESVNGVNIVKGEAFRRPVFVRESDKPTAAEYGTAMHTVLQHLDYSVELTREEIARQIQEMVENEILLAKTATAINVESVRKFFASNIGERVKQAKRVWRELPFSRLLPAKRFYPEAVDDEATIFNQGIIDLLFEEENGLVLVDYKTDWDTKQESILSKYSLQMELYREAAEELTGMTVKEKYFYLLRNGRILSV